jgi:hypothetical protein
MKSKQQIKPLKQGDNPNASNPAENKEEENNQNEQEDDPPLATVGEVFSFAQTGRVKAYIVAGCCCAVITGISFPGEYYVCQFSCILSYCGSA